MVRTHGLLLAGALLALAAVAIPAAAADPLPGEADHYPWCSQNLGNLVDYPDGTRACLCPLPQPITFLGCLV